MTTPPSPTSAYARQFSASPIRHEDPRHFRDPYRADPFSPTYNRHAASSSSSSKPPPSVRTFGPAPLIRSSRTEQTGALELQPQGLELLEQLGAGHLGDHKSDHVVQVVFAMGGSRVGKSSVGNALLGLDENTDEPPGIGRGFRVGHGFEHVTVGVDVAARVEVYNYDEEPGVGAACSANGRSSSRDRSGDADGDRNGEHRADLSSSSRSPRGTRIKTKMSTSRTARTKTKTLIYCDCEGSFHPRGSSGNFADFGLTGLLAYCAGDWLMPVTMGNVDERDLENLAWLGSLMSRHLVEARCSRPGLMLLVNAPRFAELSQNPEEVLAPLFEEQRNSNLSSPRRLARSAVRRQFVAPLQFASLRGGHQQHQYQGVETAAVRAPSSQTGESRGDSDLFLAADVAALRHRLLLRKAKRKSTPRSGRAPKWRSGRELALFLRELVQDLNRLDRGHDHQEENSRSSNNTGKRTFAPQLRLRPESAVDRVCKQLYLDPLKTRILADFTEALQRSSEREGGPNALRQARITQEKMCEFDAFLKQLEATSHTKASARTELTKELRRTADVIAAAYRERERERELERERERDRERQMAATLGKVQMAATSVGAASTKSTTGAGENFFSTRASKASSSSTGAGGATSGDGEADADAEAPSVPVARSYSTGGRSRPRGATENYHVRGSWAGQAHDPAQLPQPSLDATTPLDRHRTSPASGSSSLHTGSGRSRSATATARSSNGNHSSLAEATRKMNAKLEELEGTIEKFAAAEGDELQALLQELQNLIRKYEALPPVHLQERVEQLGKRLEQLIGFTDALGENAGSLGHQSARSLQEVQLLQERHFNGAELVRIHQDAMKVRHNFAELESKLLTAGEKVMRVAEDIDGRLGETEELLKEEEEARRRTRETLEEKLAEKHLFLRELLAEEREDRRMRESVTEKMVQAVSSWLATQ